LRAGVTSLDLGAAPALLQVAGGLLSGGIADLNVVIYSNGTCRLAKPRGNSLVLDDIRPAFHRRDSALHMHRELIGVDLGFGEFGADQGLELRIGEAGAGFGRGLPLMDLIGLLVCGSSRRGGQKERR
jgi:hypothetical protein